MRGVAGDDLGDRCAVLVRELTELGMDGPDLEEARALLAEAPRG